MSAVGREVTDRRVWLSSPSAPSWGLRRETGQSLGRAGSWEEPGRVESAAGRVQRPRLCRAPCNAGPGAAAGWGVLSAAPRRHQGGHMSPSSGTEKDFTETKTKCKKKRSFLN